MNDNEEESTNRHSGNAFITIVFEISFIICLGIQLCASFWLAYNLCLLGPHSIEATYVYYRYSQVTTITSLMLIIVFVIYGYSTEKVLWKNIGRFKKRLNTSL